VEVGDWKTSAKCKKMHEIGRIQKMSINAELDFSLNGGCQPIFAMKFPLALVPLQIVSVVHNALHGSIAVVSNAKMLALSCTTLSTTRIDEICASTLVILIE
jgi:hypothetical protein